MELPINNENHPTPPKTRAWGPKEPWKFKCMKNIHSTLLHAMLNNVSWSTIFCVKSTYERWVQHKNWKITTTKKNLTIMSFILVIVRKAHMNRTVLKWHVKRLRAQSCVSFHYTWIDVWLHNLVTNPHGPLDVLQRPSQHHDHGPWP